MIKGTIECSFGEVKTNAELSPCELLFAIGIQETENSVSHVKYQSQCMLVGGGLNPPHVIECLGESIMSMLEEYCEGNADATLKAMMTFQKLVKEETNEYMMNHVKEILAEKEKM
ncbi:hypothetical protein DWX59_23640 [Enterocloster aldenensis]|uniref:hypothetical protein n=1 Tax=Enterocloster aldenensis TaxID=358742 RepID=UPI000E3FB86F|nr:hypothetical protein DWX59_23640 [Enterocloster aldenensis]